ncbi:hypothetical protein ACFYKT_16725 [Cytobacillus sp. FJAT-53684]|uniref:Uncharacterized protein n=1 Tax=Cytobacillus mangrovibacter TaxID=3299024 RepID=A0ABW6K553_9BACI
MCTCTKETFFKHLKNKQHYELVDEARNMQIEVEDGEPTESIIEKIMSVTK